MAGEINILLVINIVMAIGAIGALIVAICSLRETQKTRRDSFLPIVIPRSIGWDSGRVANSGNFKIENIGRGPAWNIKVEYPGGRTHDLAKYVHNETHNRIETVLPWPDFNTIHSSLTLTLIYYDTFNRKMKVRFKTVVDEAGVGRKVLRYKQQDGFDLILAK